MTYFDSEQAICVKFDVILCKMSLCILCVISFYFESRLSLDSILCQCTLTEKHQVIILLKHIGRCVNGTSCTCL